MENFREVLENFKKEHYENEIDVDIMKASESSNPGLSLDSKNYKEGNKYIFKQPISQKSAEELINLVSKYKEYNEYNINVFKEKLRQSCGLITVIGESATEMLIYSSKCMDDNQLHRNCILDELKNLKDADSYFLDAFKNILANWTWNEQVEICIKASASMSIKEVSELIYDIFEKNPILREEAAKALIDIGDDDNFENIISLLISLGRSDDSRDIKVMIRNVFYYLGKRSDRGSSHLYVNLIKKDLTNELRNILVTGIRQNITPMILENIRKRLNDSGIERYEQIKLIRLLEKIKTNNPAVIGLLKEALDIPHIDKVEVSIALGNQCEELENIITDETIAQRQRMDAVINMGRSQVENRQEILQKVVEGDDVNLKIAAHSALFEMGQENDIVEIFRYLVDVDTPAPIKNSAKNQIKRLRSSKNKKLIETLEVVIERILKDDTSKLKVLTILDIYSTGIVEEDIGRIFLEKLKSTQINEAKVVLLDFFNRNIYTFSPLLQAQIREEIVKVSKDSEPSVSKKALECLKLLNRNSDLTPN